MFYFRTFLISLWIIISSLGGVLYSLFRWGNLNINRDFARIFSWVTLKIIGLRVEVDGKQYLKSSQPCIYIANHQSNMDMATFGGIYPQRTVVIGKKEVRWMPFFGLFFMAAGNILIDRQNQVKALAGLARATEIIKKKSVSIWIFPEGTRNRTGEGLLPFKRGAFHMAIQAGVPLVPIVSGPIRPFIHFKGGHLKGGVLKIKVLPPIETSGVAASQVEVLAQEVREKMLEAFHGLTI